MKLFVVLTLVFASLVFAQTPSPSPPRECQASVHVRGHDEIETARRAGAIAERAATHTIVSAAPIVTVVPSCSSSLIFLLPVIHRTLYPNTWFVEDVGVDHCRAHIFVAEQLLHCTNVVSIFQQVRRERVAQGVTAGRLMNAGLANCSLNRSLQQGLRNVIAIELLGLIVIIQLSRMETGREQILPAEFPRCVGVFSNKSTRQRRRSVPFPTAAFRHGYDLSFIPSLPLKWIAVVVSATSAGICEETGFRGYMQQPIEQRHGAPAAILVSSFFFVLLHLTKAWAMVGMVPIVFGVGVLLGLLAWSSGSLIPGMIGHVIMDIGLFAYWWTGIAGDFTVRPITETGVDPAFLITCAVLATTLIIVLLAVSRLRQIRVSTTMPPNQLLQPTAVPAR